MEPEEALRRLGGVTDAATLRAACTPWQIRVALGDGRIDRPGPLRYALPGTKEAQVAAARVNGVLSHLSAAVFWGWKVKTVPEKPVVTVRRGRRIDESRGEGVDVRRQNLPAAAIHRGLVTTRVQTVVDCVRTLPFDAALSVVDSALREGCVTRPELLAAIEASPRTWRGRAVRVVSCADGRAANPFESCLRAIALEVPGLSVQPQLPVPGIGHADLGDPGLRLLIEADSYAFHSDEQAFRHDIRRYTAMVRAGWTMVRFCWEDVMFRQDYVREVLVDLVAAGCPHATSSSRGGCLRPRSTTGLV